MIAERPGNRARPGACLLVLLCGCGTAGRPAAPRGEFVFRVRSEALPPGERSGALERTIGVMRRRLEHVLPAAAVEAAGDDRIRIRNVPREHFNTVPELASRAGRVEVRAVLEATDPLYERVATLLEEAMRKGKVFQVADPRYRKIDVDRDTFGAPVTLQRGWPAHDWVLVDFDPDGKQGTDFLADGIIADAGFGETALGHAILDIRLTDAGKEQLPRFARRNLGRSAALLVDGELACLFVCRSIPDGDGIQLRGFGWIDDRKQALAAILRSGPLPASLQPVRIPWDP